MHPLLEKVFLSRTTRLVRAVENNDVQKMKQMLDEGVEVKYSIGNDKFYEPLVHIAVRCASNDCLLALISRGARLNIVNSAHNSTLSSWFSLAHASIKNQSDISEKCMETARILLENGAEFGTGGRHHVMAGTTPYTFIENNPPLVELEKRLRAEVAARILSKGVIAVHYQPSRSRL